jgi:hypothetical protein
LFVHFGFRAGHFEAHLHLPACSVQEVGVYADEGARFFLRCG